MAAVRAGINANFTGVLPALLPLLQQHPVRTIQLEWSGDSELVPLLEAFWAAGFVEVQHRGPICARRWAAESEAVVETELNRAYSPLIDVSHMQHSPCRLFSDYLDRLNATLLPSDGSVEIILLRRPSALLPKR